MSANSALSAPFVPVQPKTRPILFSGAMVRALLEGRKTQTRRIIKPQPPIACDRSIVMPASAEVAFTHDTTMLVYPGNGDWIRCPYGQPGERLWVRETFYHGDAWYPDRPGLEWKNCHRGELCTWVDYRATYKPDRGEERDFPWTPSIFMPRWASRITLEIESVRVDRLQEISGDDAITEGVAGRTAFEDSGKHYSIPGAPSIVWEHDPVAVYAQLWESINGPGSWALNPWVWVVTFKKIASEGEK